MKNFGGRGNGKTIIIQGITTMLTAAEKDGSQPSNIGIATGILSDYVE
ncbi:MAG: hypothetical protein L0I95_07665 [Tetragenococcus koreensis]|nr:hypothetical protein [Tetragenococcus halophilus]MDN6139619.1 hypothetical protein [Tetragenococcus koreensis]MDN6392229.1 hypothetical protein [Lactococcus lactis]MDN6611644.1 hypothetical protein [Staphylococcus equorum]MDN6626492.1 hypothetical protein [Pisciglobus halotolerans]MCF1675829.1 hypothetical protein [Tetragenococcus halophilus]